LLLVPEAGNAVVAGTSSSCAETADANESNSKRRRLFFIER